MGTSTSPQCRRARAYAVSSAIPVSSQRYIPPLLSRLPRQVGERELQRVHGALAWPEEQLQIEEVVSAGPGNALLLELESERLRELFTAGVARPGAPEVRP